MSGPCSNIPVFSAFWSNLCKKTKTTGSEITMGSNCDVGVLNADSHSNIIDRNSIENQRNSECNQPMIEVNNTIRTSQNNGEDSNASHARSLVSNWDLFLLICPILAHLYDLVTDFKLTSNYFKTQETFYGCLTLALNIIPSIISVWVSSRMHSDDSQEEQTEEQTEEENEKNWLDKLAAQKPNVMIAILLQLTLLWRYLRTLSYAWKVRKYKQKRNSMQRWYSKMREYQEDVALLNVIDCFLESALQLIVQLTILLMEDKSITTSMWFKIVGGCVTLITFGWSMTKYHSAIRLAQSDKAVISVTGRVPLFIWHFCTIAARIFLIGIAASKFPLYTWIAYMAVFILWAIWIYKNEDAVSEFCRHKAVKPLTQPTRNKKVQPLLFSAVIAQVYMFSYLNLREEPTCKRYSIYYTLCGLQNLTIFLLWVTLVYLTPIENDPLSRYLLIVAVVFFFIGIATMVTYYIFFHHVVPSTSCNFFTVLCLPCIKCGHLQHE